MATSFCSFADAILEYARLAPKELAATVGKRASNIARIAPGLYDSTADVPEPISIDKREERFGLFDHTVDEGYRHAVEVSEKRRGALTYFGPDAIIEGAGVGERTRLYKFFRLTIF